MTFETTLFAGSSWAAIIKLGRQRIALENGCVQMERAFSSIAGPEVETGLHLVK